MNTTASMPKSQGKPKARMFDVKSILAKRTTARGIEYHVRWAGHSSEHDTWEPAANLNCNTRLAQFEKRTTNKEPEPSSTRSQVLREASSLGKRKGPHASGTEHSKQPRKRRQLYSVRLCPDRRCGRGVFAFVDIPANTFLFEYAGERVDPKDIRRHKGDIRYFWLLTDGVTIDASQAGNASRFINHYEGVCTLLCVACGWCGTMLMLVRRAGRGTFGCR